MNTKKDYTVQPHITWNKYMKINKNRDKFILFKPVELILLY